jgi:apolipoprotein N-acyltransferase
VTRRTVAAFAAGGFAVAAFSPFDALPVGLAALAVLVHLWSTADGARACFRIGWWFGAGFFGAGVSWIYVSLNQFGGMASPVAALATLAFCAFLALFPALAGWLQSQVAATPFVRATLVIPPLWAMTEWVRGTIMTGFPWLSMGSAVPGWSLAGYAPLVGMYGCTLVVVALAGLLACVARKESLRPAIGAALVLALGGEALRHVEWTTPAGQLPVTLLQGNVPQEIKFAPERYANTLERYAGLVEASRGRLIVLPETAVPRFLDRVAPDYIARLESAARRNDGDLLLGIPVRTTPDNYLNSVITLGMSPSQRYDKAHLVPFGEFVPPGLGAIMRQLSVPLSDFSRGTDTPRPLEVAGTRVAVSICYENAFGEEVARQLPAATLLVNASNVAWFGDSLAPAQHLQISRMRAIETGRMHLTATNTGISAAIERDGRVVARLPQFEPGRIEHAAKLYEGATPYVRIGDLGALALAALMLVLAAIIRRPSPC